MRLNLSDDLPAYFINLDRAPERLQRFLADNAMPGIAFTRMAAVDGQMLDREALIRSGVILRDLLHTNNVLGCSLSHIACWQRVAQGDRPTLICEDDAVLRRDFAVLHRQALPMIERTDIVFWGCNLDMHVACDMPGLGVVTLMFDEKPLRGEAAIRSFQDQTCANTLYRLRRVWGAAAYTITPRGARRLLELVLPLRNDEGDFQYPRGDGETLVAHFISCGIDMTVGLVHAPNLDGWIAVPPVALARNNKADSAIEPGGRLIGGLA